MRHLGYRKGRGSIEIPRPSRIIGEAWFRQEDPVQYREMVEHLCGDDPKLVAWRGPLAMGEAGVVLTGQQPAMLGGPLYTLYKTLTAIVRARRMRAGGVPTIAAFWCVGDDTDHDETAGVSWPRPEGPPTRWRDERESGGERIGGLLVDRMQPALRRLSEEWPEASGSVEKIEGILSASESVGWSGFLKASLGELVGEEPLLFIDGNDPEVQRVSQPFLRRFLDRRLRERIAGEVEQLLSQKASGSDRVPLGGEEVLRALFLANGQGRVALEDLPVGERAEAEEMLLLPNVVLRPLLQEHLMPVQQVVCGEAEIAYRSLLGPLYGFLGREHAAVVPRFSATIFPDLWASDPDAPDPAKMLEDPDDAIEAWARADLDPALLPGLGDLRARVRSEIQNLIPALDELDRSLQQVAESAQKKVDYQIGRIEEAVLTKARNRLRRDRPVLAQIREILLPRGKPQERAFTLWLPLLAEGEEALRGIEGAVEEWIDRGETGHALLALEKEG